MRRVVCRSTAACLAHLPLFSSCVLWLCPQGTAGALACLRSMRVGGCVSSKYGWLGSGDRSVFLSVCWLPSVVWDSTCMPGVLCGVVGPNGYPWQVKGQPHRTFRIGTSSAILGVPAGPCNGALGVGSWLPAPVTACQILRPLRREDTHCSSLSRPWLSLLSGL